MGILCCILRCITGAAPPVGGGGFSLLECCAIIYCYRKVSACCTATKLSIKNCCKSIISLCDSNAANNHAEQHDIDLIGIDIQESDAN